MMYATKLPYHTQSIICTMLNENKKWEIFAGKYMQLPHDTIETLKRSKNPTAALLTKCHQNFLMTVEQLFNCLYDMEYLQAADLLLQYLDSSFSSKFSTAESNLQRISMEEDEHQENSKNLESGQNFNQIDTRKLVDKNIMQVTIKDMQKQVSANTFVRYVDFEILTRITDHWSEDLKLIRGSYGSFYSSRWENKHVAIKRMERRDSDFSRTVYVKQLQNMLRSLDEMYSCQHNNILPLYAYSLHEESICLVYHFMPNGSVQDRILQKERFSPLTWLERLKIAEGTAKGLAYLHSTDQLIVHGNIKSTNILLDQHLVPKLGDFQTSRERFQVDDASRSRSSRPFFPNDSIQNEYLTTKYDTYSYGIVLFELATGLVAYDVNRVGNKFLKDLVVDSNEVLKDKKAGTEHIEVHSFLVDLGKLCSNDSAECRPEMGSVVGKFNNSSMNLCLPSDILDSMKISSKPSGAGVKFSKLQS